MKRLALLWIAICLVAVPSIVSAQTEYPQRAMEKYWECMERNDLDAIQKMLWHHNNVEPIDASIYGLPKADFDDRSMLTINERLSYRQDREVNSRGLSNAVPQATSGPLQYPHHLRAAYDHAYEVEGSRPDCSAILTATGMTAPARAEDLEPGWASDYNLTGGDSLDRGEVDIAVDVANSNRIMASSCPGGGSEVSDHIAYTSNWGQSWTSTSVGNNSGTSWECDPVSFYQRATGRVYHSKIGCSNNYCSNTYTMMRYSTNNGASWADCGRPGSDNSEDREWFVVDNTATSACYGNIYATWHNSNQEKVATSTNDCSSWTNLTNLTSTYNAITPDINVAADGHVYVVWQNHGDSTFKIAGSSNCGATWSSPSAKTLTSRNGDWTNNLPAQCQRGVAAQPTVDVDRAPSSDYYGRVYVVLQMFSGSCSTQAGYSCSSWDSNWSNTCNYDFFLMYSDNQGSTWTGPVNLTSGDGNKVDNFLGYMRVDEADGSIYIGYHRSRLNPASATDRQRTNFFVTRSIDGGATWETPTQASSYEGTERSTGGSSFERGDYQGFAVYDGVAWPVWIDRRGGTGEEEIVTRKMSSPPAHWTERSPTFSAPATTCSDGGSGTVDVTWDHPDIYWGDGGENSTARKYQLWVDGSLEQDNISSTTKSYNYNPGDSYSHTYFVRAVNSDGVSKDYGSDTFSATSGCANNPSSVSVTPNGPLTFCEGTGQTLTASASGGAGLSYQWYRNGSPIGGATSSTYYANGTGINTYNCVVTGSGCSTGVSDPADTQITWGTEPIFDGAQAADLVGGTCTIQVVWDAATPLCSTGMSYNVYRSTSAGFTPGSTNRIALHEPGLSYDDENLSGVTTYYYTVRAEDGAGYEDSNSIEVWDTVTSGTETLTLLTDAFESSTDWTNNWTVTTGPGSHTCGDWARSSSSTQRPPNSSGYYALTDSDACGSSSQTSTDLTSKVLDADGATSVTLEYDLYYRHYSGDNTSVQVWDGYAWQTVWADSNANVEAHHTWDLTAYANPYMQVKFSYQNASYDWWFAVDNVTVTAEVSGASCP